MIAFRWRRERVDRACTSARVSTENAAASGGGPSLRSALAWRRSLRARSAARFIATRRTHASGAL